MSLMNRSLREHGAMDKWLIISITFIFTTIVVLALGIWALVNYLDQKNNVDTKVETAVSTAVKEQGDELAANFAEEEKKPNRTFAGPEDYGSLSFSYPKTWSIYVNKDASSGDVYEAYLNPISVPPIKATQQYALHVTIESKDYDQVIKGYESQVKKGDLRSSAVSAGGVDGTRLDGTFTKDIRGAAVIFKIRDKTATIRTDADTFKPDFDALVATIKFNQ